MSSRRRSFDLILQRAVSEISPEGGIARYMDLRLPPHFTSGNDVSSVECECCGLFEDYTRAYVRRVRDWHCGRWVCGLCSEAVKCELDRLGLACHDSTAREEAISAHMEVCRRFNKSVRMNPAKSLVSAMADILKKRSRREGSWC